ncbi:SixA phosphatase family protein [Aquimarina longa]|uniref:SixA phosphatase family protein n=1 Tax=Aquimarina longa TaxID=1080221 RepID=UPI00078103F2|nr:phosphoglycerate mutase family protein [Aquimarina longa]
MKLLVTVFIFLFSLPSSSQNNTLSEATTTYFFIRHAEKELSDPNNKDPNLTKQGKIRAENWAKILTDTKVDLVYTTDYNRTQETAKPIAKSKNLSLSFYNPRNLNDLQFQKATKGKTVVIVGHSNTTPSFVNKIIGKEKYMPINEKNYSKLFIIKITGNIITDTVLIIN